MEDAATAEIARSQVWQWCNHPQGILDDGRKITTDMVQKIIPEEISKIRDSYGDAFDEKKISQATELFVSLVTEKEFEEFLTLRAYDHLD